MGMLDGKVAIVTGAARGTGEATARLFVQEGAEVLLADILDEPGESVAKELGDAARYVHLDVTSEGEWRQAVQAATRSFGALNVLVNNAGILLIAAIEDTQLDEFERVVRVNQTGAFLGIKSVIPAMKQAGGGSIVNVSSVDGLSAKNGLVAYSSSKWALRGITRVAALELGRFGIRVNVVCPESGNPTMIAPYVPAGIDLETAPAFSQPHLAPQKDRPVADKIADVARFIAFLASDGSASCTGADFAIDGGNTAGQVMRGMPGS